MTLYREVANEEILTAYMQNHYTDERLAALLAHAEDGKLSWSSCCCFVGVATADHALEGRVSGIENMLVFPDHLDKAFAYEGAGDANVAYEQLGRCDEARRAKLIPLIKAEMARREAVRQETEELTLAQ